MKCLFLAFQAGTGAGGPGALAPLAATLEPEEDVLSLAASAVEFAEYEPDGVLQDAASRASAACSRPSTRSSTSASEGNSMGAIIPEVIPSVTGLKRLLARENEEDTGIKTMKKTLLEAVQKRFKTIENEPLYAVATLLDPRFKDRYFTGADSIKHAKDALTQEVENMEALQSSRTTPEGAEAVPGNPHKAPLVLNKTLHQPMHLLLINLPINDLIGSTAFFPQIIKELLLDTRKMHYTACLAQAFCIHTYAVGAVLILSLMAYDRVL
ncbi:unnamed protein product [Gadus morhua 'NCC']